LFQENIVTPRLDPHQTQTARKGFILRHRDVLGGHLGRQAGALRAAVRDHGFFNTPVDLVLRPIRCADKPIKTRELSEQTHQANPTGADLDTDQVDRQDQSMQEGEPWNALETCHNSRAFIETLVVRPPGL
jgi:hypothetical protein